MALLFSPRAQEGETVLPGIQPEWRPLLERFEHFPGMTFSQAQVHLQQPDLPRLLEMNLLVVRHTIAGETLSVGPAWRVLNGLNPRYQSSSVVLEDSVYLLGVMLELEEQGYSHHGRVNRTLHDIRCGTQQYYLVGSARGIRARTVRRLAQEHTGMLIRAGARLIVATPKPRMLRTPDNHNPMVLVHRARVPWTTATRQRGRTTASDVFCSVPTAS